MFIRLLEKRYDYTYARVTYSEQLSFARLYVIIMINNNIYTFPAHWFCNQEDHLKGNQIQGRRGADAVERAIWKLYEYGIIICIYNEMLFYAKFT